MPEPTVTPQALAAGLAARIIHDLLGPASGVTTGIALYGDASARDLKDEAMDLAASSSAALTDLLAFSRVAFGANGAPIEDTALAKLAQTQFAGKRAQLVWPSTGATLDGQAAQAILILVQIAVSGLPRGGDARVVTELGSGKIAVRVIGEGPGSKLHPEALEGLAGRSLSAGLTGRWAPAYYLSAMTSGLGGGLSVTTTAEGFILEARLPA